jgi:hypothetical protein
MTNSICAAKKKNCTYKPITNAGETIDGHDLCHYYYQCVSGMSALSSPYPSIQMILGYIPYRKYLGLFGLLTGAFLNYNSALFCIYISGANSTLEIY